MPVALAAEQINKHKKEQESKASSRIEKKGIKNFLYRR